MKLEYAWWRFRHGLEWFVDREDRFYQVWILPTRWAWRIVRRPDEPTLTVAVGPLQVRRYARALAPAGGIGDNNPAAIGAARSEGTGHGDD